MSIEHFRNDAVEGVITHINGDGEHTEVQVTRFNNNPNFSIQFSDLNTGENGEPVKNPDGTVRLKNPTYLHIHSVSECKFLILALREIAGFLEGRKEPKESEVKPKGKELK